MQIMPQQSQPDDDIPATGQAIGVHDFTLPAFEEAERSICFVGEGGVERSVCEVSEETLTAINPRYLRPTDIDLLIGDASKTRERLGLRHTTPVRDLVRKMVRADFILIAREGMPGSVSPVPAA